MAEASAQRQLLQFMRRHARLLVLTGAGISSASGIPTYRDHRGRWQRGDPIQHRDFVADHRVRQRYWARSLVGWKFMRQAQPNGAHRALVELEARGHIELLVTQNVDGLHQRAGSRQVLDLHGRVDTALCLSCGVRRRRADIQGFLERHNPALVNFAAAARPDGDAAVDGLDLSATVVPTCDNCGGVMKPDVVFFGDSVPRRRVEATAQALHRAGALLVVGSSLMVYSGYRFCRQAAQANIPIAIVNRGVTRADDLASCKVEDDCATALERLLQV